MSSASDKTETTAQKSESVKARVPWNPWLGVLLVIVLYYASQFVSGLLLSIYPFAKHWSTAQANVWLNNSILAQFFFILLAESFTLGAIYLFLRHYKLGFRSLGLVKPHWKDVGYGLLGAIPYYVVFLTAASLLAHLVHGFNVNQQQQIGFSGVHGGVALMLTFASLVILPPLTEEIMVRGLLYSSLKKTMPVISAGLITSVLFAAAHLPEGGAAGPLWIGALDTFTLSLVLVYLRQKTGSLWGSITLHALKNGVAFVALFILHQS